jgi:hypothetical protein
MRRILAVSLLAMALSVVFPLAAFASAPVHTTASGTLLSHTQNLVRAADGNLIFSAVDIVSLTGGVSGLVTDTYTLTVHADGSIAGHGIETCSACTIGGHSGGYTEVFSFTATANFATFAGSFAVLSGSGGLSGLHGQGTFQGAGLSETVALNYHFEPAS